MQSMHSTASADWSDFYKNIYGYLKNHIEDLKKIRMKIRVSQYTWDLFNC